MPSDPSLIGLFCLVVPCDDAFETTPTAAEVCLLVCPDGSNVQMELQYIGFRANTLPIDGSAVVEADIEWIDDSDSDGVTNLVSAYNFLVANNTAVVGNTVWQGRQILDPGDVINAEMHVTTPDTASEGAAFVVVGRVLSKSGT